MKYSPICPKCGYELLAGVAMAQKYIGYSDLIGGGVVAMSYGGPGKIVIPIKCPSCGYSNHICDAQGEGY